MKHFNLEYFIQRLNKKISEFVKFNELNEDNLQKLIQEVLDENNFFDFIIIRNFTQSELFTNFDLEISVEKEIYDLEEYGVISNTEIERKTINFLFSK